MKSLTWEDRLGVCCGYLSSFWLSLFCERLLIYKAELTFCSRSCKGSLTSHFALQSGHMGMQTGHTSSILTQWGSNSVAATSSFQEQKWSVGSVIRDRDGASYSCLHFEEAVTVQWPFLVPVPNYFFLVSRFLRLFFDFFSVSGSTQYPFSKFSLG